jgi:hypothetical protein
MLILSEGSGRETLVQNVTQQNNQKRRQQQMSKITQDEIDHLIIQTNQKANRIKHVDKLLSQMPESRSKKQYLRDMMEMIDQYNVEVDILEFTLDEYLEQIKKETGEVPLLYYRLSKALKES